MVETDEPVELTPRLIAIARGRACDLLGLTLLHGVQPVLVEGLRIFPDLDACLPDSFDSDSAGAEHYRVLDRGVPPVESLFLGCEGLVGGDVAAAVRQEMLADGVRLSRSHPADHLGLQLGWLSHLLGAEADAHEDGRSDLVGALHSCQRRALDRHLFRYVQPLVEAVDQLDSPLYSALVETVLQFLGDLRGSLSGEPEPWSLTEPPRPLAHPDHRLRDIAEWLCIPSRAGVYLSLPFIQQLGRELDVPSGFGRRADCLESLLQGAVRFETLPRLLEVMDERLAEIGRSREEAHVHSVHTAPWQERLNHTRAGLAELGRGASSVVPQSGSQAPSQG